MPNPSQIVCRGGRLYHLGIAPNEVARSLVLVGDPARALKVAARFDSVEHEIRHREYVTLTGRFRGRRMTVVGTGIGTDNVEIALVELHAAHAVDLVSREPLPNPPVLDIVRVGTSGGVQPGLAGGTLCIAEYALGLDSTGPYYEAPAADARVEAIEAAGQRLLDDSIAPESRFHGRLRVYASKASPRLVRLLIEHATAVGEPHASGITASTPGFFGPSSRHIEGLVNTVPDAKGALARVEVDGREVLNMEMESSLLFHLAGALGHRAATICPVISAPASHGAVVDYDAAIETAIGIALDTLLEAGSAES